MKKDTCNLPVIAFDSKKEAENAIINIIIPYLLENKDVCEEDICGW